MTDRTDKTTAMNPTGSLDELDNKRTTTTTLQATDPDPNGNGSKWNRGQLTHSVSIIVEPVLDDIEPLQDSKDRGESCLPSTDDRRIMTSDTTFEPGQRLLRKERIHSSPIIVMDDHFLESKDRSSDEESTVRSIIQTARLRKEEFAKLLEEHAQLVNEINRVETSLV